MPAFIKHNSHLKCHPPLPPPIHLLFVRTFASLWLDSAVHFTVSLSFGPALG